GVGDQFPLDREVPLKALRLRKIPRHSKNRRTRRDASDARKRIGECYVGVVARRRVVVLDQCERGKQHLSKTKLVGSLIGIIDPRAGTNDGAAVSERPPCETYARLEVPPIGVSGKRGGPET